MEQDVEDQLRAPQLMLHSFPKSHNYSVLYLPLSFRINVVQRLLPEYGQGIQTKSIVENQNRRRERLSRHSLPIKNKTTGVDEVKDKECKRWPTKPKISPVSPRFKNDATNGEGV